VIHTGDCLEVMATFEPESVDAIVTDPPYNLVSIGKRFGKEGSAPVKDDAFGGRYTRLARGFMGKEWDGAGIAFRRETWEAAYRVAKPSAYLLAFGGTRTVHRMTVALEDAGWIIRDMLVWAYASGFPKSKAGLKPAWEPIVMARKPGPLRMLAIDECRIAFQGDSDRLTATVGGKVTSGRRAGAEPGAVERQEFAQVLSEQGRWPANVILTDPIFDGGWDGVVGGGSQDSPAPYIRSVTADGGPIGWNAEAVGSEVPGYGDSGTYSRFFLIPKADRTDREPILGGPTTVRLGQGIGGADNRGVARANVHPTVKPVDLMRHLVRLVTPAGGTVLDPFGGSGTTALACELEGFPWILIEKEPEYVAIAEARLNGTQRGLGLVG